MGYKTLTIPKPCSQNWDDMTPDAAGKFCQSCATVVADFTKLSDEELVKVLQAGTYKCCKLTADQVEHTYQVKEVHQERKRYWTSIAAAIVAGMIQLSISYGQTSGEPGTLTRIPTSRLRVKTEIPVPAQEMIKETRTFSFLILDKKTKKGLNGVEVYIDGLEAMFKTDSLGRVELTIPAGVDLSDQVLVFFTKRRYMPESIRLSIGESIKKRKTVKLSPRKGKVSHFIGCPSF